MHADQRTELRVHGIAEAEYSACPPINGIVVANNSTQLTGALIAVAYGGHVSTGEPDIRGPDNGGAESLYFVTAADNC